MDNQLSKDVQRRATKRKVKGMVFKWRIDGPRTPPSLRTTRDTDAPGQKKILLSSPLDVYRMRNDSLRLDPMDSLPVPASPVVGQQLDYFVQSLAPFYSNLVLIDGHANPYLSIGFPFSLQNPMCFEAFLAHIRCLWLRVVGQSHWKDLFLINRRGNALKLLQRRLSCNANLAGDDVVLTIARLVTVELFIGNLDGLKAHAQAIQQIKKLRRGREDSSPLGQYTAAFMTMAELTARHALRNQPDGPIEVKRGEGLEYPQHPFPHCLSKCLSSLPDGFVDVALSGSLSFKMLGIIEKLWEFLTEARLDQSNLLSTSLPLQFIIVVLRTLFAAPNMPEVEKYLFYGLFGFCTQLHQRDQSPYDQATSVIEIIGTFDQLRLTRPILHRECVIWSCLSFAGATSFHHQLYADQMLDAILSEFPETREWERLETIIHKFFWTENTILHWKELWEVVAQRRRHTLLLAPYFSHHEKPNFWPLEPFEKSTTSSIIDPTGLWFLKPPGR